MDEVSRVLITNAVIGFFLILLILFVFLDFSTAFWTAFGLPVTMILTLAYMGGAYGPFGQLSNPNSHDYHDRYAR